MKLDMSPLPDPALQSDFYRGVPLKRLLAWIVDTIVIFVACAILATLPLFLGWLVFPLILLVVSFLYRFLTISSASATPGMRLMNIQFRNKDGAALDAAEAAIHTLAFMIFQVSVLLQIVSAVLMIGTARGQSLQDFLTGVVAINRPSQY